MVGWAGWAAGWVCCWSAGAGWLARSLVCFLRGYLVCVCGGGLCVEAASINRRTTKVAGGGSVHAHVLGMDRFERRVVPVGLLARALLVPFCGCFASFCSGRGFGRCGSDLWGCRIFCRRIRHRSLPCCRHVLSLWWVGWGGWWTWVPTGIISAGGLSMLLRRRARKTHRHYFFQFYYFLK